MRITSSIFFVFIIFLTSGLGGCAMSRGTVVEVPVWTSERPISSQYYIGISAASKLEHPYDAMEVARENALNSMAREIRVKVSSTSLLQTLQVNKWVEESFASTIESTVGENLEGYELVDQYESENEVWVYYRLSKSDYERILSERKRVALGSAFGHYLDAERKRYEGAIPVAIERYLLGLDVMAQYLGELNPYTGEDGISFDLDRALFNGLSDCISQLKISFAQPEIKLTLKTGYTDEILVQVQSEDRIIGGIPLNYRYSRGSITIRGTTVTSGDGKAVISLNGFNPGTTRSELHIEINTSNLVSILKPLSPLKPLVKNLKSTPLRIPILLESPKIRVVGLERLFGRQLEVNVLIPALRSALIANGVEVVDVDSPGTLILQVNANTQAGGEGSGFYSAFLDASIELIDENANLILQKNLVRIKGVQLDRKRAGEEAYRKGSKEIEGRFTETFVKALYK